jgi:hypothetical protein
MSGKSKVLNFCSLANFRNGVDRDSGVRFLGAAERMHLDNAKS